MSHLVFVERDRYNPQYSFNVCILHHNTLTVLSYPITRSLSSSLMSLKPSYTSFLSIMSRVGEKQLNS